MSLRHAILTALLERPSTGLELTRRFDRSIGYFWSATHQQVYRELARLEVDGLVRATAQPGLRGNPRSYDVLPEGRARLRAWVEQSDEPRELRDALMLRMRAAAVVGADAVVPQLEHHLDRHRARLAEYRAIEERDFPAAAGDDSGGGEPDEATRLRHLVLRAGIELEEHWTAWLQHAFTQMSQEPP